MIFCTTFKKDILAEIGTISRGVFGFRRFSLVVQRSHVNSGIVVYAYFIGQ